MKRKYMLISYFLILSFLIPILLLNALLAPKGVASKKMRNKIISGDYQTTQKALFVIDNKIINIKKIKISIIEKGSHSSEREYENFQYKMYFYTDTLEEIKIDYVQRTRLDDRILFRFDYKEKDFKFTIVIAPNCIHIHRDEHIYYEKASNGFYYDGLVLTLSR